MESAATRHAEDTSPLAEQPDNEEHEQGAAAEHDLTIDTDPHLPGTNDHVTEIPPFWSPTSRHGRSVSYQSIGHNRPRPILLEDHSEEDNELSQSCWAQSATIDEYVLVTGPTGIGAYVVWHCTVKTLKGGDMTIRKR